MLKRWLGPVAAGVLLAGLASARAEVAVPPLKARVTDLTGTLSGTQQQDLERRLREFESRKGSQIAVLMLPSTDRKSTRLNSSHGYISYAVFCLKKKNSMTKQNSNTSHKIFSEARIIEELTTSMA